MITSLSIRGFQAHKKLTLDVDPHVTTIVGPTDSGKSAILRALRWLMTNQPNGDAFIRHGAEKAVVSLSVDGHTIQRSKGKANQYQLDDQIFEAFGAGNVPEPIARILQIGDGNFQRQHDSPFWFALSAGECSRQLNEIVDLGLVDDVLAFLNGEVRAGASSVRVSEERLDEARRQRASLKWTAEADAALKGVKAAKAEAERIALERDTAAKLVGEGQRHVEAVERGLNAKETALAALLAGQTWADLQRKQEDMVELVREVEKTQEIASQDVPDVSPLERAANELSTKQASMDEFAAIVSQVERQEEALRDLRRSLDRNVRSLRDEIGDQCPLCGARQNTAS